MVRSNWLFNTSMLLIAFLCSSCINKKTVQSDVVRFYELAQHEDVSIFLNLTLIPRQFNAKTQRFELTRISHETLLNGERIVTNFPAIRKGTSIQQMQNMPLYANVGTYARQQGITPDSVVKYLTNVYELYDKLHVIEIISHPDLGKFIQFKLLPDIKVVYLADATSVYHPYWKSYFKSANLLGKKWYFKNSAVQKINTR